MAKGNRKINKSLSLDLSTVNEVEWLCDDDNPKKRFANFSDAMTKLSGIGLIIIKQEDKIQSGEFIQEMNGMIQQEKTMDWLHSLSGMQRSGLKQMIMMIDDQQQRKIV